jgi:hypothetical protein
MRCKVRARPPSVPRLGSNQSRFTDRRRVAQGCLSRSAIDDQQDFLRRPGQRPQRATNAVPAGISRRRRFVFRAPAARPSTRVPGTARRPALRRRRSPPASCPGCLQTGPLCEGLFPLAPLHHRATRPAARRRAPRRHEAARGSPSADASPSSDPAERGANEVTFMPSGVWSLYGAQRSQPVAIRGKCPAAQSRVNRQNPLMVRNAMKKGLPVTRSSLSTGSYREEARFDVVRRFGSQPQASRLPSA